VLRWHLGLRPVDDTVRSALTLLEQLGLQD